MRLDRAALLLPWLCCSYSQPKTARATMPRTRTRFLGASKAGSVWICPEFCLHPSLSVCTEMQKERPRNKRQALAISRGCGPRPFLELRCNGQALQTSSASVLWSKKREQEPKQTKSCSAWFYWILYSTLTVVGADLLGVLLLVVGGFECLFFQKQSFQWMEMQLNLLKAINSFALVHTAGCY